ncbi:MAG: ABC transporter ATP-binding protein [Flavobacteriaceae bacterium]|nr:ABC transporter ATP-binding protein [Flavobacteriaceae bacterium]
MTSEKKHNILKVDSLSIGYWNKKNSLIIAKDISFHFSEGTLISLVGANGIGKSTLLRTLANMQKPIDGTIQVHDKNLNQYHPLELATLLSVVLTEAPSSKNLSVLEFVSLGRQPHTNWMGSLSPEDKIKIKFAITQTDLDSLKNKKCSELSDGQMQRVAIARAIAQDTPVILLDEPTTHLDLYHRASILKLLKKLTLETKKTILFSTHEIDLAIQLSDQMILMTEKETLMETPAQLIKDGHFDRLFPKDFLFFDASTGRFTIKS